MIRVSVMYPYRDGARFDVAYYAKQHMDMTREAFANHGLVDIRVDKGFVGPKPKSPPIYVCIGTLTFETMDNYKEAFREHGERLFADIPNFTDITPVVQVNEAVL
ncbi:MAG TPA: EthD family reductase [bacterium]|nr:EthD family reductase [bacterium]